MSWQAIRAKVGTALSAVKARLTRRLLIRTAAVVALFSTLAITTEAIVRGHLGTIASRLPTALYTRPGRSPIALATVSGAPPEYRIPVGREDIPEVLTQAVLAVEDQRFETHWGLDVRRIGGALVANLKAGRISQGGSTLTQQLVKNLFLTHERTPLRKLREAALALAIEARHDKAEILEAYLNEIYLGQDGGRPIHGVGAGARYFFGKDVSRLSLPEAALLAGMIRSPNRTNPLRHERAARQRRNLVLSLMREQGRIGEKQAVNAARVRIATRPTSSAAIDARYFRDYVVASLPGGLPERGGAVFTTIDPTLQRAADRAVKEGLRRLGTPDVQGALVALDPKTGDILAMVGGRDYGASQFNRATDARRQPGSAFKPIVALAALEQAGGRGPAFTLASRIDDEPLTVRTGAGPWEPSNYDRTFHGEVTLREALEQSFNIPFVKVGLEIGPDRIVAAARRLGIASPLNAVPSLALGSSEVSLLELVRAYGVFAAGGRLAPLRAVVARGSLDGTIRPAKGVEATQVADPGASFLVTSALQGVITRGTGRALQAVSGDFGELAGKTGTSNDWRDGWFIAYSPTLVVGAWVGYDDGRSLRRSGADVALPLVARFLERADPANGGESFEVPDGVETASPNCDGEEYFLAGTAPESACDQVDGFPWDRRWSRDQDADDEDADRDDDDHEARDRAWRQRLERRAGRAMIGVLQRLLERAAESR